MHPWETAVQDETTPYRDRINLFPGMTIARHLAYPPFSRP